MHRDANDERDLPVREDNPNASDDEPFYELPAASAVSRHSADIDKVAKETGVDARLIRAIIYMETTHGYYDMPLSWGSTRTNLSCR
jgi:hypothetical protein